MHALAGACAASNTRYGAANKQSYNKFIPWLSNAKVRKRARAMTPSQATAVDGAYFALALKHSNTHVTPVDHAAITA